MNQNAAAFLPAGVLLVGVMFISGIREQYVMKSTQPMSAIPTTFDGQKGRDIAIDTAEQRVAGMSDFSLRQFNPDTAHSFSIYVGYYDRQIQGKTIHSPKNCLPGAGWQILSNDRVAIPSVTGAQANRVLLTLNNSRALVYYWYQGRGRIEANEYRVKWDLLRDAALRGRTEEALVRIVVNLPPHRGNDADAALAEADSLVKRISAPLVESVYKVLPPFGPS
ncbi:MAG: exosortase C-terminal domain/associated protein EpsI [Gemmatimonadaceae bacterium]